LGKKGEINWGIFFFLIVNFTSPVKCGLLSRCAAGSFAPGNAIRIVIYFAIVFFVMLIFYGWHRCILNADKKFSQSDYDDEDEDENNLQKPFNISDLGDFKRITIEFKKLGLVLYNGERVLSSVTGKLEDSSLVR
jgi:uncharacterized ion transporter superfamily protein YfcC